MNKIKIIIIAFVIMLMLSGITNAKTVDFRNSTDSMMRKYQQDAIGSEPSPGYYTYWSAYVISADGKPHWIEFGFVFDSGTVKERVYVVPGHYTYIKAPGYMKTWTNRVNITVTKLT